MADQRPNIILLMDDQHRWDTMGCVNPLVKTPTLDRLAESGTRLDQAVCQAPACVPSRYSMMLGLYPSQIGVRTNGECLPDEILPYRTPRWGSATKEGGWITNQVIDLKVFCVPHISVLIPNSTASRLPPPLSSPLQKRDIQRTQLSRKRA